MDYYNSFNNVVNSNVSLLEKPEVRAALTLALVLYGNLARPVLPDATAKLFGNVYVRLIVCFLIVWTGNRDPLVSLAVAVSFIAIINVINDKQPFETFEGPQTAIMPGCMNITVYDLLESFKNDKDALFTAMQQARVPGDIKLNDEYAPLIATYLLSRGFILKSPCTPPGVGQSTGSWI